MKFATYQDGIRLSGELFFPQSFAFPFPTVVICHGIPSGRPVREDSGYRRLAAKLSERGFLAVIFNFRGCGESGGNIDLAGWSRDLTAILNLLSARTDVDPGRLSLLGFSGGAAVSCQVAAQDNRVRAVVLAACPAELSFLFPRRDLAVLLEKARQMNVIRDADFPPDPDKWLDGFHSVRAENYIGKLAGRPLLVMHGTADDLVPAEHAERLFNLAGEPKELLLLEGAGHRLRQVPEVLEAAVNWLSRQNGLEN